MHLRFLLLTLFLRFSIFGIGQSTSWKRYPVISPDGKTIVFTYKGDLYYVPSTGGLATQLTVHPAHDYKAIWSPDGRSICFASDRYGNFDIYVMPALGGEATRLTYHSTDEYPYCFTPDGGQIYFGGVRQDRVTHRQFPTNSQPELYSVPIKGGKIKQILTTPAQDVQINPQSGLIVYHDKKGGENEWRKHHTSSITRDIWTYNPLTGKHRQITKYPGEDRQPVFGPDGESLYYLSERSGSFNIWKMPITGDDSPKQISYFDNNPVRFLSISGHTLCFGYNGDIYLQKEGEAPHKVDITIHRQSGQNNEEYISIGSNISEMSVSPNGKEIAFIARGEVFVTSTDKSFTKQITHTPETERFVTFSADGDKIYYSREKSGKWTIHSAKRKRKNEKYFFISTLIEENTIIEKPKDAYIPRISPDGNKMAYVYDRKAIVVRDLKTGKEKTLIQASENYTMRDGDKYFRWSPDSKWLLYQWGKYLHNSEVLILAADGSKRYNLTKSGYQDYSPKWINNGKQMIWMSNRNGLKSYATSGQTQSDVYTMFFDKETYDEFHLNEDEYKLRQEMEEEAEKKDDKKEKDKKKKKDDKITPIKIDWKGLDDRKSRLTIHSSILGDAVLSKDGQKLYYLAKFEDKMNLWTSNLRTKETKMAIKLGISGGSLQWDRDMKNLYLLAEGSISKLDVEQKKKKQVKIKGEIRIDKEKEREILFDHIVTRTKNIFYDTTFHGVNWDKLATAYRSHLKEVGTGYEFAELVSEMIGELNVSHAGARYRRSVENADATASLGILVDWDYQGPGIKIAEILNDGPMDKTNIQIQPGDIITAIDGQSLSEDKDVSAYLNKKAGKQMLLDVKNAITQTTKQWIIKPISLNRERRLLYKRWVETNRNEVRQKSGGKLGYVHIPGMGDGPYRTIIEEMLGRYDDAQAVIIDTRFNGGGDLVADLVMFFTGKPFITYATDRKVVGGEPTSRWTKPTLALINEAMYSDGHCFACGYSELKIGPTVGMPVPGTCSWAGWEFLPNGLRWGVVPISSKDLYGHWMENLQTEPDYPVKNQPEIISQGRDQQLEKAIEILMQLKN